MPITKLPLGGAARIRGMSGREEELLYNRKKQQSGEAIEEILANCVEALGTLSAHEEGAEPEFVPDMDGKGNPKLVQVSDILRLHSPDREKLLFDIRRESFGDEMPVSLKCSSCDQKSDFSVDLSLCEQIPVPEDYNEDIGFSVTLSTGVRVQFNYMDGNRERVIAKQQGESALTAAMLARLGEVEGVDKGNRRSWLLGLPIRIRTELRNLMAAKDCGVNTTLKADCQHCGEEMSFIVIAQPGFLFPEM